MAKGIWTPKDTEREKYWAFQLADTPEYITKVLMIHERKDQKSPYMILFSEEIGVDHWWGGRRRFGHDHRVEFNMLYFEPSGDGNFLAGERIDWVPHYGTIGNVRINRVSLEKIWPIFTELPDSTLDLIVKANELRPALSDEEVIRRFGVPCESLLSCYQDPKTFAQIQSSIIKAREKSHPMLNSFLKERGYDTPLFDIKNECDRKDFILEVLKIGADFDIESGKEVVEEWPNLE